MNDVRSCPLCDARPTGSGFPGSMDFGGVVFNHYNCGGCGCVYVDPIPDDKVLNAVYDKVAYHDIHYSEDDFQGYAKSLERIKAYAPITNDLLDYGCGTGSFLLAANSAGFNATGVELSQEFAVLVSKKTNCRVYSVQEFFDSTATELFDVIRLGDVLEHLPEPKVTVSNLLPRLRPGGIMIVEGPIENNLSVVFVCSLTFYFLKKFFSGRVIAFTAPTHLYRANEAQQLNFFSRQFPELKLLHWKVYETGWPYSQGGWLKRFVAFIAVLFSGRRIRKHSLGNRFEAIFIIK